MSKLSNDFVSNDPKKYEWKIGRVLASSLSGFIAGIIVASIFFITVFELTLRASNLAFQFVVNLFSKFCSFYNLATYEIFNLV